MIDYSGESPLILDGQDRQDFLDLSIKHGFVDLSYDIYGDRGFTIITMHLASLRPEQNQKARAWFKLLRNEYGPGTLEVRGGVDGVRYSLPEDKKEAELEILRAIWSMADPVVEGQLWMGFS